MLFFPYIFIPFITTIEELALINEQKRIKKNWFSRLCGCVTKDTRNNIHCNESNITNTNSINSNTDDDIEIHPIVLVNGSINRSEDKISYANSIIHKMIKDKVKLKLNYCSYHNVIFILLLLLDGRITSTEEN